MPTHISRNISANIIGKICTAIVTYGSIPLFIRYLGMESYALIGISLTLNQIINLLDFGLSMTLNKGLARLSQEKNSEQQQHNLLRTLETVYLPISLIVLAAIFLSSDWLARNWLQSKGLSIEILTLSLKLIGVSLCLQWPYTLYQGGLLGLQRQVLTNKISIGVAIAQNLGGLFALSIFGHKVEVFFYWQIVVSLCTTLIIALSLRRALPKSCSKPYFEWNLLKQGMGFNLGMLGITLVSFCSLQADKIVLLRLLPLATYSAYLLASQISSFITQIVYPVTMAVFPKMTQLLQHDDQTELTELYHRNCQIITCTSLSLSAVICFFATPIIHLIEAISGKPLIELKADQLLMVLSIASGIHALLHLPHSLQLAADQTRSWFVQNSISLFIQIPILFIFTHKFGALGGAYVYLLLQCSWLFIQAPLIHRSTLRGEFRVWFLEDTIIPTAIAFLLVGAIRWGVHLPIGNIQMAAVLVATYILAVVCTILGCGRLRPILLERILSTKTLKI